jgi:outer membrane protein OmpA-like peptidoglycan-associated protein
MGKFRLGLLSAVGFGALLCGLSGPAYAGSVTEAGETVGLALGAPLPPGWYFVDTASYISRNNKPDIEAVVNIPVIAVSTPWQFAGGRIEAYAAFPEDILNVGGNYSSGFYNIAFLVGEAWDFGNGWNFSNFVGGYTPMKANGLATNNWVFNERAAVTYLSNGWDLTAHVIYGKVGTDVVTGKQDTPDYINYDLTAVKTFGKWTIGPVGYGSADLSSLGPGYVEQSQFALGGLVGYDFGPLTFQIYITHDLTETGYTGEDTRAFLRWVVPLFVPEPEAPPSPPPPPVAPPPPPPPPVVEAQRSFQVFFDFDKSNITDAAAKVIQSAADAVRQGHFVQITVTGHTDTVGTAAYNQGLSERRAAAVKQALVGDGVADGEITTVGVGKTGLLVPTADGVREPQNRRAEIVMQ